MERAKLSKIAIIALTIAAVTLGGTTIAAISLNQNINSSGIITVISTPTPPPPPPPTTAPTPTSSPTASPTPTPPPATPAIGVYSDSACTQSLSTIDWGSIAAGSSTTKTIYLKDTGTGTLTLTGLTTSSWSPSAAGGYITITWDKTGTQLTAGQSTTATLTLTVLPTITGVTTFSNTITIQGTG